jgi:oligosaccharide amylase
MPRDIPVSNGTLLVSFDRQGLLRDLFFPHVGQENHAGREPFRFGVWADGQMSWVPDGWRIAQDYLDDTLVTKVELSHDGLGLLLTLNDLVDVHENVYLRRIVVQNLADRPRDLRLVFSHPFGISGNDIGDTAAFRPDVGALLHYKGDRCFLINAIANRKPGIDRFTTGNARAEIWRDASDGELEGVPIAQGSVDSVAAIPLSLAPRASETAYYWICAGKSWAEVAAINAAVQKRKPETILARTRDYWRMWVGKEELNEELLPPKIARLYRRSLIVARSQIDNAGAIIAGNDSDVIHFNRDTYSYLWPRDAALCAYGLDLAGYPEITRRFFEMCGRLIEKEGYFLHKYTPTGNPASSWHPWIADSEPQLPIQEDETALVLWALWQHYLRHRDIEFVRALYAPLIKGAADFLMSYRDLATGLPLPSYDLWEEHRGVATFTCGAVVGGLAAASRFAQAFGDEALAEEYAHGATRMREAMDHHLYVESEGRFARMLRAERGGVSTIDRTLDASLMGLFAFGAYPADDPRVASTMNQVADKLWCKTAIGGLARYEGDGYYRAADNVPGNPWFVATLWLAQYQIAAAKDRQSLDRSVALLEWVADRALASGVLAEQVHPLTGEPLSISPLTWSHGTFVIAVQEYLTRLIEIEQCPACGQPKYSRTRRVPAARCP